MYFKVKSEGAMERQKLLQKRKAERLDNQLVKYKGVVGIDVEHKRVKDQKTDTVGITVYVEKKLPQQKLSDEEAIPSTISGIPTDVVEIVYMWGPGKRKLRAADVQAMQSKQKATMQRSDVLVGGLSLANQYEPYYYGTLGIVLPSKDAPTALSCAHVMVDPKQSPSNTQGVIEPQGGQFLTDCIGTVSLYYFNENNVDAALVPIAPDRAYSQWTVEKIGEIEGWGTASVGDQVEKMGVTSGYTTGVVSSTSFTLYLTDPDWGDITLENQIKIDSEFSKPGDSGSAAIDCGTKKMIGMVEAGGQTEDDEFFTVIQPSAALRAVIPP